MNKFPRPIMTRLVGRFLFWAQNESSVRAIVMVGSMARRDHLADEWSDLDMVIYVTDLDRYHTNMEWLESIGEPWVYVPFIHVEHAPEYLALFEDGNKLDFAFEPLDRLQSLVETQQLPNYMQRGYEILLDKDRLAQQLAPPSFTLSAAEQPSQADFDETLRAFWYGIPQIAKYIRRRDLWVIKAQDSALKEHLLHLIEWHAQAAHNRDTWHSGRFMAEWADPQIWSALPETFGGFDAASSWRALLATIDLFRRLATETAQLLQYSYPTRLDEQITQWVNKMQAEDSI